MDLFSEYGVGFALLAGLTLAMEAGFQLGRRAIKNREAMGGGHIGAIQGAILGLLGLLLGFSFAGAASRHMERQDLVIREANAISTAYLRADVLAPDDRVALRDALRTYLHHRVDRSKTLRIRLTAEDVATISALQEDIWAAALAGVQATPGATIATLGPVNEVLDLHSSRVAASEKHLPLLVLGLLLVCSALGVAVIGYGCALERRRNLPVTGSLVVLISAALWTTIDMDHARVGMIRISDAPLARVAEGLRP